MMKPHSENTDSLLTVAVLSLDIMPGNIEENLLRVRVMLDSLPEGVDIAVLPELFTTSFMKDTDSMLRMAETNDGLTMRAIREWAAGHNLMIAGTYLAADGGRFFNRGFMALPDGRTVFYDKHHLFCLSKEAELLTHGDKRPPVVNFRGWNVSMCICYELRFPVWSRNIGMKNDIVLVPANWPAGRGYAWRHLLIARAIENQVVMAGADCSGNDDYGNYDGLAMMVDELGRQVAPPLMSPPDGCPPPCSTGTSVIPTQFGPVLTATFSLNNIRRLRDRLPAGRDADNFILNITEK